MDAVIGVEPQLNAIVKQYMEYMNYVSAAEAFEEELSSVGKSASSPVTSIHGDRKKDVGESLLSCFASGNYQHFFKLWTANISSKTLHEDVECRKLEFNLRLYFAVFPLVNNMDKMEIERRKKHFKTYLETTGSSLSQSEEFLPYYALPFIPDVMKHPSFKPLFTDSWRNDLQKQLKDFLSEQLKSDEKPELYNLYKARPAIIEKERQQYNDHIKVLKNQLAEAETKLMSYFKKFSQIQGDYHKLIGIAAELVDSLEDTIRGKLISSEYIQDLCARLFNAPMQQSLDINKPGMTSNMLRASIAQTSLSGMDNLNHQPLDFEKIKNDLTNLPERKKAFLLQALRWRLTRSPGEELRHSTMRAYIGNDLLGCAFRGEYQDTLIEFLQSSSAVVCQYFAGLLNTMASMSAGRSYLSQSVKLVEALQKTLTTEPKNSLTSENILGCLQKLSLRRHLQTQMIESDLVSWLIDALEDHDSLSDYTLEYSVALLMNLCLRTSGKQKCSDDASHILRVLSDLLGHENQEIRPYVNGSLYSILALPHVREDAREMGMQEILECFLKDEDVDMQRQVQFIIKQLNLGSDESPINYDVDSDDEDDDIDEEGDAIDEELDKQEILEPGSNELAGEELLEREYLILPSDSNNFLRKSRKNHLLLSLDQPLSRPVTPGSRTGDNKHDNIPRPATNVLVQIPESISPPMSSSRPGASSKPGSSRPSSARLNSAKPSTADPNKNRPRSAKEMSESHEEAIKVDKNYAAEQEEKMERLLQNSALTQSEIFGTKNKLRRSHDSRNNSPRSGPQSIPPLTRSISPPPPKSTSRPGSANRAHKKR
ncbi:lisH domain-containing protein ARMC9-like [Dendronephthya gigantea]|uniref:lisH domain-containing protein ARMC9-like n=1 Tax=Dendronephthya gigantea TaxID=151771 RepID=UPI00106AD368|nr:lisH domain-containing protein ARMC9-like [Dendronephthya gigantea]XP_028393760.1 lisH domain-containing protein ARMC9-like [Dendronephthya gigantea]